MGRLFLAAEGGRLYSYDPSSGEQELVFQDDRAETLMGLARTDAHLLVGAKTRVHKIGFADGSVKSSRVLLKRDVLLRKRGPDFHQMIVDDDRLLITATHFNEVWELSHDLELLDTHRVAPPRKWLSVIYKKNYNHLNHVYKHDGKYYACLNWLSSEQYGPSGVAVLDTDWNEIERFSYGWEAHNFSIIDGERWVLCGSSGAIKPINHPHRTGLMVDGEFVFEHSADEWFCKDFCVDDNHVYIVGGSVNKRSERHKSSGVLFVLSKDFELVEKKVFPDVGGLCGVLTCTEGLPAHD